MYNIDGGRIVWRDIKRMRVSPDELEEYGLREGDLLVNRVNSRELVGKTAVIPSGLESSVFESKNIRLRLDLDKVRPKFINYQLLASGRRYFSGNAQQVVGMASVSQKQLADFPIVLSDLATQDRIVAEIEKQFSRLDEAVASLKRVKANLKRYKAAVLKAAVEGRLVPTEAELARREGRRYETGTQLLQCILETRRSQWKGKGKYKEPEPPDTAHLPELPEGWTWSTYGQVGQLQLGRQRAPKYHSGPNMRPYLRVQNVFEDRIDLSDVMEMDFSPGDFEKYQLAPGDLLLNEGQSPELLGRPAIYRGELRGACFTNTLIRLRAIGGMNVEFALLLSRHNMHAGRFVDEGTITTNIAHLSLGRLATVEFPLPPLAEQTRIIAEVDRRLSLVRETEAQVDTNRRRTGRLRDATLSSAFGG
ncbi:MAG: restriction endonuclease subunit S [Betaproteobacteria bacterium]|nr:restriction endonuclease subunit S [Betaproteobacteria bacterium]